jgi:hypothetical protein
MSRLALNALANRALTLDVLMHESECTVGATLEAESGTGLLFQGVIPRRFCGTGEVTCRIAG